MLKETEIEKKKHNALLLLFLELVAFQLRRSGSPPPLDYAYEEVAGPAPELHD